MNESLDWIHSEANTRKETKPSKYNFLYILNRLLFNHKTKCNVGIVEIWRELEAIMSDDISYTQTNAEWSHSSIASKKGELREAESRFCDMKEIPV